jgi:hypothetical protein
MTQNKTIGIDYTDQRLRVLVEEYIIQQRGTFFLQGVCNYVLYWAMEEGHTTATCLYEGNQLCKSDCDKVKTVLDKIISEGRLITTDDGCFLQNKQ